MTHWLAALVTWWATLLGPGDTAAECLALGRLDAERARAFAAADPAALEAVYADDALRRRDQRVLRDYAARGLRLEGMAQLRSSCRLVDGDGRRLELEVVDRLGPTRVTGSDGSRWLPRDRPTRRSVTLVRSDDGWRVRASR